MLVAFLRPQYFKNSKKIMVYGGWGFKTSVSIFTRGGYLKFYKIVSKPVIATIIEIFKRLFLFRQIHILRNCKTIVKNSKITLKPVIASITRYFRYCKTYLLDLITD